eukprot:CAMPEP_0194393042 /NCGR_PEP_ID=MMETSP0174-20130528/123074_1 /TAXON_ID=216777 /ORGANISM="Proboscia alata, Strain PI-D3" /LENGTH=180 /DNA_ID=CAMNT_0039188675 /DNA_START=101 /DNA_END=643 /DNA_ORIENTATION=-
MTKHAKKMGNYDEEVKHTEEAESARLCIPHFNIEGLLGWKPRSTSTRMSGSRSSGSTKKKHVRNNSTTSTTTTTTTGNSQTNSSMASNTNTKPSGAARRKKQYRKPPQDQLIRFPGQGQVAAEGFLNSNALKPIELTESASKQWGTDQLIRFPGQGQFSAEGLLNSQWMERTTNNGGRLF